MGARWLVTLTEIKTEKLSFVQDPPDLSSLKVKTGFHRWFGGFPLPDLQPEERAELSRVLQVRLPDLTWWLHCVVQVSPGEREMLMSRSMALAGGWGCLASLVSTTACLLCTALCYPGGGPHSLDNLVRYCLETEQGQQELCWVVVSPQTHPGGGSMSVQQASLCTPD